MRSLIFLGLFFASTSYADNIESALDTLTQAHEKVLRGDDSDNGQCVIMENHPDSTPFVAMLSENGMYNIYGVKDSPKTGKREKTFIGHPSTFATMLEIFTELNNGKWYGCHLFAPYTCGIEPIEGSVYERIFFYDKGETKVTIARTWTRDGAEEWLGELKRVGYCSEYSESSH